MSHFKCEECGTDILEGSDGHYITGCSHYPIENMKIPHRHLDMTFEEFMEVFRNNAKSKKSRKSQKVNIG